MAPKQKQVQRSDPYRNYKFRIKWDGQVVAGVSRVSALARTTEAVEYRDGGNTGATHKMPGRTHYEPITLERGVTHDSAFETWANHLAGDTPAAVHFRKEVRIEVYDAAGRLALAYDVHRCWPTQYVVIAGLESGSRSRLIQSLTLENEGWTRDTSVGRQRRARLRD